ncbi:MAG TPA: carboxypeptidase-like regulatory domain-containing protein [Acidobacteriaceae bacterium]|jgi:hypothetical protein|nr:carboxypeptidase-like regulatory domain-containing protein [Acidobacteriaceae bacterium]
MQFRRIALSLSLFLVALLAGSLSAAAQSTANLAGTVTDPSGAVVPNARITVHNPSTGIDRTTHSDSAGNYSVASLQPGNYALTVQATGFAAYKVLSVTLLVDQSVTVNARLAIASAGEVVNVQSTAPILEAQSITVGQSIDEKTVQEMPLNGRHFLDLTNLVPGTVVPPVTGSLTAASRGLGTC